VEPITPDDQRAIADLLRAHFPAQDLRQMAAYDLAFETVRFATAVDFERPLDAVAFAFVQLAVLHGRVPELVRAMRVARPLVPEVGALAARLGGVTAAATAANPGAVRYAAGQFTQAFRDRQRRLARLAGFKALHDVLHQLDRSQAELARLVEVARQPGYDPLDAGEMPDVVARWLAEADRPDRRKGWVKQFVADAGVVVRCLRAEPVAPAEADTALARLRNLPGEEQAELNERLVEAARDLDAGGLITPLPDLLNALGPADKVEFGQRFDQFQADCDRLARLTDDHDRCQQVDEALVEAAGLARVALVPAGTGPRWDAVVGWFDALAETRPDDPTLKRLKRELKRIREAGPAAKDTWLPALRTGFGAFFFDLDAELLDATDRVLHAAEVLAFRLKGYST
jgi:hypothetical protein